MDRKDFFCSLNYFLVLLSRTASVQTGSTQFFFSNLFMLFVIIDFLQTLCLFHMFLGENVDVSMPKLFNV